MILLRTVTTALLLLGLVATGHAHDAGISTAQVQRRANEIELTTSFALLDAQHLLAPRTPVAPSWTAEEFATAKPQLQAVAAQLWELRHGEHVIDAVETRVELSTSDNVSFVVVFQRPTGNETITLRASRLADLPAGHRQFVTILDDAGATVRNKLLSATDPFLEFSPDGSGSSVASAPPRFWGFLRLGIAHIWTGYDHLLFLFGLLIVCRTFRSIVKIITCFTLAHSLTLALATLNVINLPPRLVEPAIAGSIIFVGVENLLRRGADPRGRGAFTFGFGLIHGFGFASVLRDLGVGGGGQGLALPLFTFNLGVELGQVAVACVVLPVIWQLRKNKRFLRQGVPLVSLLVTVAGLYWLLERTVFA